MCQVFMEIILSSSKDSTHKVIRILIEIVLTMLIINCTYHETKQVLLFINAAKITLKQPIFNPK